MRNFIHLYWGHLKGSKKSLAISTLGLIFAITIVSSSILYVDTSKQDIINTITNYSNDNPYAIGLQLDTFSLNMSFGSAYRQITDLGNQIISLAHINFLNKMDLFGSITGTFVPEVGFFNNGTQFISNRSLIIMDMSNGISNDLHSFLGTNSTLPTNNNANQTQAFLLDVYFGPTDSNSLNLLSKTNTDNFTQGKSINIYSINGNQSKKFSVNLTGYGKVFNYNKYNENDNSYTTNFNKQLYPALSKVWQIEPSGTISSYLFVSNLTTFLTTYKANFEYFNQTSNITTISIFSNIIGGYSINYNKFDPFTIKSKINQIISLKTTFQDRIFQADFYKRLDKGTTYFYIQFINYSKLNTFLQTLFQILYEMFLYAFPMIIIAMLVTNYSFGLIQKKIIQHFGIYKTRGVNTLRLFFFQLLDYAIIFLASTFFGMMAGIPISSIVVKTNGILNFTNPQNYNVLTNFITILPYLFVILFILAIIIGLSVSLRKIIQLSKMSINESDNLVEKTDPFWQKHYIDVILFMYGFVSYLIVTYLTNPTNLTSFLEVGALLLIFFIPGPFAIIIGTLLLSIRLVPALINWIGTHLWERTGGLVAYTFKNIIRHKQSANRAILLIAALVTFLILFFAIPYSQAQYTNLSSQYTIGGEAQLIPSISQFNETKIKIDSLINMINTNFTNSIKGATPVVKLAVDTTQGKFEFLFINTSTYVEGSSVSLFHLGLENSLKDDLNSLGKPVGSGNYSVIVPQSYLQQSDSKIGDTLPVHQQNYFDSFNIIDSYTEWPLSSESSSLGPCIIMNINYLYNVLIPKFDSHAFQPLFGFKTSITMNFKKGIDLNTIIQSISQVTSAKVIPAKLSAQNLDTISFLIYKFTLGQININIIISTVISVAILMMFSYMQLTERRKEIFTERALGMKINETVFIFYLESFILLAIGLIIGSVISVYFIQSLAIFLTSGNQIPRYVVIIPLNQVISVFILIIIVSSLCSIIPPYYLKKKDIIQSFASEN